MRKKKTNLAKLNKIRKKIRWILLTGQSGAGKGVTKEMMLEYFALKGVPVLEITNSTEMSKFMKTGTYSAKKMLEINNQAKYQPAPMIESLYYQRMREEATENGIILHDGSPRTEKEFKDMLEMEVYYGRPLVIEIIASDKICWDRLVERTKKDKRPDLSKDGQPGVPDLVKIMRKMEWWIIRGGEIVELVKKHGCYESIENRNASKAALRKKVFALLDQCEMPG